MTDNVTSRSTTPDARDTSQTGGTNGQISEELVSYCDGQWTTLCSRHDPRAWIRTSETVDLASWR